jgi:hypothetical protein
MRRILLAVALLVGCAASAQSPLPGLQLSTLVPTEGTISESNLSFVGGGFAPASIATTWGDNLQSFYGEGFTLKYEAGDGGALHFLSLGYGTNYNAMTCPQCNTYTIYQMRTVLSSGIPANPTSFGSWPTATTTGSRTYSADTGGSGYGAKRIILYQGVPTPMGPMLTGRLGLKQLSTGATGQYYSFGYNDGVDSCDSKSFLFSQLDYATPASSTAWGPYGVTGVQFKATSAWMAEASSGWAALYTGGKPLIIGGGRMTSKVAECDVSMGAAGFAVTQPLSGGSQNITLARTTLTNYAPHAAGPGVGRGRENRPVPMIMPGRPDVYSDTAWGPSKYTQMDFLSGCDLVEGTVSGLVCVTRFGMGQCNYVSSTTGCEYIRDYFQVYALADIQAVATGAQSVYSLQPVNQWELVWPMIDYTIYPWAVPTPVPIARITSVAGQAINSATTGAIVECSSACSFTEGGMVSVRGTSADSEYGAIWIAGAPLDSTHFRIYNTSIGTMWTGTTALGGAARTATNTLPNLVEAKGVEFDKTTRRLWVGAALFNIGSGDARLGWLAWQLP